MPRGHSRSRTFWVWWGSVHVDDNNNDDRVTHIVRTNSSSETKLCCRCRDGEDVFPVLRSLCSLKRFTVTIMFLSQPEKLGKFLLSVQKQTKMVLWSHVHVVIIVIMDPPPLPQTPLLGHPPLTPGPLYPRTPSIPRTLLPPHRPLHPDLPHPGTP